MKKLLVIVIPLLLIVGCSKNQPINVNELILSGDKMTYNSKENNLPYTGPVFFTDENNRVFIEGHLKNGVKVGNWKFWNDDGSLFEGLVEEYPSNYSGNYIEFQEDMTSIREFIRILDGVKQGPSVLYFKNGDRQEFTYKDGVKQGPSVYYLEDGGREEITYKDGVRQGPYIYYSSSRGEYKGHKEGGTYIDGKKEGVSIYYFPDGRTKTNFYKNGERVEWFSTL